MHQKTKPQLLDLCWVQVLITPKGSLVVKWSWLRFNFFTSSCLASVFLWISQTQVGMRLSSYQRFFSQLYPTRALQDPQSHKGQLLPTSWATSDSVLRSEQLRAFHFLCQPHAFGEKKDFHKPGNPNNPKFSECSRYLSHSWTKEERAENEAGSNWSRYFKVLLYKSTKGFATIANRV